MSFLRIINEDKVPEWCIVEFQGELKGTGSGEVVGSISVSKSGTAGMVIGQHEFKGEVQKLSKAFMVVEKQGKEGEEASMSVQGIVRRKVLFNSRPKVITSKLA